MMNLLEHTGCNWLTSPYRFSGYWSSNVKKLLHMKCTLYKVDELLLLVRTNFDKFGKQLAMFTTQVIEHSKIPLSGF